MGGKLLCYSIKHLNIMLVCDGWFVFLFTCSKNEEG